MEHKIDGNKWGYSGSVVVRLPNFDECCEVMELTQSLRDEAGSETVQNLKMVRKLVAWSEKFYVSVNLDLGGLSVASFAELSSVRKAQQVLIDVATGLMNGFEEPGN